MMPRRWRQEPPTSQQQIEMRWTDEHLSPFSPPAVRRTSGGSVAILDSGKIRQVNGITSNRDKFVKDHYTIYEATSSQAAL